jgi:hypothetical protein
MANPSTGQSFEPEAPTTNNRRRRKRSGEVDKHRHRTWKGKMVNKHRHRTGKRKRKGVRLRTGRERGKIDHDVGTQNIVGEENIIGWCIRKSA